MPLEATEDLQQQIDRVPLDFDRNIDALDKAFTAFLTALRGTTLTGLQQRTEAHLSRHWGQICTIRNLYRKTRGEPARFFPENPTFPR